MSTCTWETHRLLQMYGRRTGHEPRQRSSLELCRRLDSLFRSGLYFNLGVLRSEVRMHHFKNDLARPSVGTNPDCASSPNQRKRVIADDLCRPSSSNLIASFANGRTASNSSLTRRATRVESAPSANNSASSGRTRTPRRLTFPAGPFSRQR